MAAPYPATQPMPPYPTGPPPPPGAYGMQQPPPAYVPPPVIIKTTALGSHPCTMQCSHCQAMITTNVSYTTGVGAWVICLLICFFVGPWGCCFIPFCVDSCKDATHTCPNCHATLGTKTVM
ncbi:LITAF domain-containing protein-like [Convolutriloba macropyga]|uniref:LITAF domain-containing protein-like n=1 Tax=Convolutriloba macropyga TaxID=536237 RepID=UPI003F5277CC